MKRPALPLRLGLDEFDGAGVMSLSLVRRNIYRRKLNKLLRLADDEAFFTMIWAIRAAQSGLADRARRFLEFPDHIASNDMASRYAVYPWVCETLLNEILVVPKQKIVPGRPYRELKCNNFNAIVGVNNALRSLENADDGITLKRVSVLNEIHRLSQRVLSDESELVSVRRRVG